MSTTETVRADHTSVRRPVGLAGPPVGVAANEAPCPVCGELVEQDEPIVLNGQYVEYADGEPANVDLTGAFWSCQRHG